MILIQLENGLLIHLDHPWHVVCGGGGGEQRERVCAMEKGWGDRSGFWGAWAGWIAGSGSGVMVGVVVGK
jgi:hypothetical protein